MCLDNDDNTFAIIFGCVYATIILLQYIWMCLDNDDNTFAIIFGCV